MQSTGLAFGPRHLQQRVHGTDPQQDFQPESSRTVREARLAAEASGGGGSAGTHWPLLSLSPLSPPHQYLKKLHTQERAVEEVKLAIKPYYQKKDITKEEYKDILRKAVHKVGTQREGQTQAGERTNWRARCVQTDGRGWETGRSVWEGDGIFSRPPGLVPLALGHPSSRGTEELWPGYWGSCSYPSPKLHPAVPGGWDPGSLVVTPAVPGPPDLPQQKWGDQPGEGEQPGAGLRPALPLLPQARSQARGPPRAPTAAQGARAPGQGWPGPAPAPSLRALASSSPLASLKFWTYLWLHLPTSLPHQWDDWGRVAARKRRAPCPSLPRAHPPCPQACPQCPSLLFVPLSPISLKIS